MALQRAEVLSERGRRRSRTAGLFPHSARHQDALAAPGAAVRERPAHRRFSEAAGTSVTRLLSRIRSDRLIRARRRRGRVRAQPQTLDARRKPRKREESLLSSGDDDARVDGSRSTQERRNRRWADSTVGGPGGRSRSHRGPRAGAGGEEGGMREVNVGLLGCGTVGRGFVHLLQQERFGHLRIARILVRDVHKERPGIDRALLTTNAIEVIDNCDLVVELIGGVHSAGAYIRRALRSGRDVVTANKALLADSGRELFETARTSGARIGFEASVCGGIPIIRAIERGLAGDSIESILGIVNGTCNYILTRMEESGLDFAAALRLAQESGFAEADPTLDISGADALQKLQILAE